MKLKKISLINNVDIFVPDTLNLLSSYILEEQLDWFEDEIRFIRKIAAPGDHIIDIGANYGIYTLSLAKIIGDSGKIFAFEPSKPTADTLHKSIEHNKFINVTLLNQGLSRYIGFADLTNNENSELNSITNFSLNKSDDQNIDITTLDTCMNLHKWKDISFVKIDAEGEEENIIQGGIDFFNSFSPLVMFEIRSDTSINFNLIKKFESLNYEIYKLIPGLNILTTWSPIEKIDDYSFNFFCCKVDRKNLLIDKGFLIENLNSVKNPSIKNILVNNSVYPFESINNFIYLFPYANFLKNEWNGNEINPIVPDVLKSYSNSKYSNSISEKLYYLNLSFNLIEKLCNQDCSFLRLSTLARISLELGNRELAVNSLTILTNHIIIEKSINLSEPFLLPSTDFELFDPKANIIAFVISALLTCLEKNQYLSSFYSGKESLSRLNAIIDTGFYTDEIIRRKQLITKRFAL